MRYEIVARISPPGTFGLPEAGVIVLPSGTLFNSGNIAADQHGHLLQLGGGTTSRFRDVPIRKSYTSRPPIDIHDNIVRVVIEADSWEEGTRGARLAIERLLRQLAVGQQRSFSYEMLLVRSTDGTEHPVPYQRTALRVTSYDLDRLVSDLDTAAKASGLEDERLDRAASYFAHALFLFDAREKIAHPLTRHYAMLISSIFSESMEGGEYRCGRSVKVFGSISKPLSQLGH